MIEGQLLLEGPGLLVFFPTCHRCGEILDAIPTEDPGNWREPRAWAIIAFERHEGVCPHRRLRSDDDA